MQDQEPMEQPKPKLKWVPLEANPEVWNKIIHNNGVDPAWNYVDVWGFDPELLAFVPQPLAAVIFLYPITDKSEQIKHEEEARLTKREQDISPKVIFFKQTISNACGMIALLHSLANNEELLGPGLFKDITQKAKNLSPDERAELLENSKELAAVHASGAQEGQTQAPSLEEQILLHFVCFVEVDHHLYELDGRKAFPINHGKCTNLLEGAVKVMRQFMERDPDNLNFTAVALSKTEP